MSDETNTGYVPVCPTNEVSSVARLMAANDVLATLRDMFWESGTARLSDIRHQKERVKTIGCIVVNHMWEHIYNGFNTRDIFAHLAE